MEVQHVTDSEGRAYVGYPTRQGSMFFKPATPQGVISAIVGAYHRGERVRLFYGDKQTGVDWGEEYDTMGTIGKSTGHISIPLLINNTRSMGGGALLDDSIVKITVDKRVVYKHPNYSVMSYAVKQGNPTEWGEWYVYRKHPITGKIDHSATFKTEEKAYKYVDFMLGKSNRK